MAHLEHTDGQSAAQDGRILLREGRSGEAVRTVQVLICGWLGLVEISVIADTRAATPAPSLLPAKPGPEPVGDAVQAFPRRPTTYLVVPTYLQPVNRGFTNACHRCIVPMSETS